MNAIDDANVVLKNKTRHTLPYRIGLTGNIATGKTTVGKMLVDLGAVLIDADQVTHTALAPTGVAYASVARAFGTDILTSDGLIDRKALASIVFSSPDALQLLESLVHPPVIAYINQAIATSSARVVVVEAIKLLESGMAGNYESIWVTTCSERIQLERLMNLRKLKREDALRRLGAQSSQEDKLARADVVIDTGGSIEQTRVQVLAAWKCLPLGVNTG